MPTAEDLAAQAHSESGKTPDQIAAETAAAAAGTTQTPEQKAAADAATAAAAAAAAKPPETYTLITPADSLLTDADLQLAEADAKALGLTQAQAQQLVDGRAAYMHDLSTQFLEQAKADPEIGGAHFETTVKHAIAGRDWLFPAGSKGSDTIRRWFDATGLGNHPEFLRAMARIGKSRAEDTHVQGGRETAARRPTEDVLFPSSAKS
jgi:hypothetical protein